jgi:hypothetical protein
MTGPITEAGKARSRANAMRHGLSGAGLVLPPEVEAEVTTRLEGWGKRYEGLDDPRIPALLREGVVASVQMDRCMMMGLALVRQQSVRDGALYEEIESLAAEKLFVRLRVEPGVVAIELRMTAAGCRRLAGAWRLLAEVSLDEAGWGPEHLELALDLLGVSGLARRAHPLIRDAEKGGGEGQTFERAEMAAREAEQLDARAVELEALVDGPRRQMLLAGYVCEPGTSLALVWKYESRARRAYERAVAKLEAIREEAGPATTDVLEVSAPEPEAESQEVLGTDENPAVAIEWTARPQPSVEPVQAESLEVVVERRESKSPRPKCLGQRLLEWDERRLTALSEAGIH